MNIKNLMSGIAVVIDDAYRCDSSEKKDDKIFQLVGDIEKAWNMPFYKTHEIPSEEVCDSFLLSASFVLLDWKLWPDGGTELENRGIENNIKFLKKARDYFVPVFIFTNESPQDVKNEIQSHDIYDDRHPGNNFIFIRTKRASTQNRLFNSIQKWVEQNASVYTLKAWEQELYEAKRNLFSSMYEKSPDWPRVFWSSAKEDNIDPSFSLFNIINNNLLAHMGTEIFDEAVLDKKRLTVESEDIKSVMEGAHFIPKEKLPDNNVRAGDIFKVSENKYLINIRADCDCIPRKGKSIDDIKLYCVEGKSMRDEKVRKLYSKERGNFEEKVWQSIVPMICGGKVIEFDLRTNVREEYSKVKMCRVGRLIHPYITKVQQRYAFYFQRQGLPRIPKKAILDAR